MPSHRGQTGYIILAPITIKDDAESGHFNTCNKYIVINIVELFIVLVRSNWVSLSIELEEQE